MQIINREFTDYQSFLLEDKEKKLEKVFFILEYSSPAINLLQSDLVNVIWQVLKCG